jgi:hypothetical protein
MPSTPPQYAAGEQQPSEKLRNDPTSLLRGVGFGSVFPHPAFSAAVLSIAAILSVAVAVKQW